MRSSPNHVQDAFHYTTEQRVIHQFDRSNPFWSHYRNICGLMTTEKGPPEMELKKTRFTVATWWEVTLKPMCKIWEYVSSIKVFFFLSLSNDRLNGILQCLAHSVHIYWNNVCALFTHTHSSAINLPFHVKPWSKVMRKQNDYRV